MAVLRPIRPTDKPALVAFHNALSPETRYRRYHAAKGELTTSDLRYLTEVDGRHHLALVAEVRDPALEGIVSPISDWAGGAPKLAGVARIVADPQHPGEFELAIVVRDDVHGAGLGHELVTAVLERGREVGVKHVLATVQSDNHRALRLFQGLGFRQRAHHGITVDLVRDL